MEPFHTMGELLSLVTTLHQNTERDYVSRMLDEKVGCMGVAKKYGREFWDGERRFGYGGYKFIPGWWRNVAQQLITRYGLNQDSAVLDIGCGKAFLLYELACLLPGIQIHGIDISEYAIESAPESIQDRLECRRAQDNLPYEDNQFNLVISLGALHNLRVFELESALREMERVGEQGYLMVESYRSNQELFNLQCWALTAESFFEVEEWIWLFERLGYSGDYEFIFFE